MRESIFAARALLHVAAQMMRNQLMTITDAQNRYTDFQKIGIDVRASGDQYACWSAGNDDAFARPQLRGRRIAGLDVSVHAQLTDATRDAVCILPAGIEYRDLRVNYVQ